MVYDECDNVKTEHEYKPDRREDTHKNVEMRPRLRDHMHVTSPGMLLQATINSFPAGQRDRFQRSPWIDIPRMTMDQDERSHIACDGRRPTSARHRSHSMRLRR
jgi:hypothetical protein